jgi:hypothetical protein
MGSQVAEAGGQLMAIRQWPDMKRNKSRLFLFHQPLLHFAKWSLRLIHQLGAVSQYTIAGHGQALQVGDPNCQWPVVAHSGPGQGGSQMASAALTQRRRRVAPHWPFGLEKCGTVFRRGSPCH